MKKVLQASHTVSYQVCTSLGKCVSLHKLSASGEPGEKAKTTVLPPGGLYMPMCNNNIVIVL